MSEKWPTIIQNAVHIPEVDLFLVSTHASDFVQYDFSDAPNDGIAVDGGLEFVRRYGDLYRLDNAKRYEEYTLTSEDPFEPVIVNRLLWGTRGKDGDKPLTFRLIASLTLDHLEAIIANCPNIGSWHKRVVEYWIDKKKENERGTV